MHFLRQCSIKCQTDRHPDLVSSGAPVGAKIVQPQSYQHYNEIQTGPHTGKVLVEAKSYPFEKHFHREQNCEHEIDNLQNEFELLIVLKVDIFEAERKAGNVNILILN